MYTKDMLVMRIKLIALSQIRNIEDSVKKNPMAYRKDTIEYCEAMHAIIEAMSMARLTRIVVPIYENYEEMGMADDGGFTHDDRPRALSDGDWRGDHLRYRLDELPGRLLPRARRYCLTVFYGYHFSH